MSLHDYMKSLEAPTKMRIEGQYFMLRADGRAFHSYCRGFAKPYDEVFMAGMDTAALALAEQISGSVATYTQSDEISVLIRNSQTPEGKLSAFFGGDVVKMTTAAASIASVSMSRTFPDKNPAYFDARVFPISDSNIARYFFWRQRDAMKNSVTMCAEQQFSKKALTGRNTDDRKAMLAEAGNPWESAPEGFQRGRFAYPVRKFGEVTYTDKRSGEENTVERRYLEWETHPAPHFEPEGTADLLRFLSNLRINGV